MIVAVAEHRAEAFYDAELDLRRRFGSPLFGRLVKLTVSGRPGRCPGGRRGARHSSGRAPRQRVSESTSPERHLRSWPGAASGGASTPSFAARIRSAFSAIPGAHHGPSTSRSSPFRPLASGRRSRTSSSCRRRCRSSSWMRRSRPSRTSRRRSGECRSGRTPSSPGPRSPTDGSSSGRGSPRPTSSGAGSQPCSTSWRSRSSWPGTSCRGRSSRPFRPGSASPRRSRSRIRTDTGSGRRSSPTGWSTTPSSSGGSACRRRRTGTICSIRSSRVTSPSARPPAPPRATRRTRSSSRAGAIRRAGNG